MIKAINMTYLEVIGEIKKKFGSITKFAELTGQDRYQIQKTAAASKYKMTPEREKYFTALWSLAKRTKVKPSGKELTPELRARISDAITKFGGVEYFCQEHNLSPNTVFHVSTPKGRYKNVTGAVRKIMQLLNIEE